MLSFSQKFSHAPQKINIVSEFSGPIHSEDLFVDIDLNESSTTTNANAVSTSAKDKPDKIKEEDNNFMARYG